MILGFKVKNYRSIKNELDFNFEAECYKEHQDSLTEYNGKKYSKLYSIYGPNASGKSSFINAFYAFKKIIGISNTSLNTTKLSYIPFLFSDGTSSSPTSFEITFVSNDIKYRYGFSYNLTSILEEHFFITSNGKEKAVFERTDSTYKISEINSELKQYESRTLPNKLFLVTLAQFNFKDAVSVCNYLLNNVYIIEENRSFSEKQNSNEFSSCFDPIIDDPKYKAFLLKLLQCADLYITDIHIEKEKTDNPPFVIPNVSFVNSYKYTITVKHDVNGKSFILPLSLESEGTRNLVALGHLFYEAMNSEKTLIMDELDNSLHPSILRFLIESFIDNSAPRSQLLFTSHNTSIMTDELFRRDQIVFFDKDKEGSTYYRKLSDFKVRSTDKFERDYLLGRFGGIPSVVSFLKEGGN